MAAATTQQLTDIDAALSAVNSYISQIQAAQRAANNLGKSADVMTLHAKFVDAQALETSLNSLYTITAVDSLNAAITAVKQTTDHLNNQKNQIDRVVKDVGIAADVLTLIANIAAEVAKL